MAEEALKKAEKALKKAEEALQKVENRITCSICFETYTDPKLLQCFHVYCRKCLVPLHQDNGITCPACRQVTPVPDTGVAGLQPAFHISHLLEIRECFPNFEDPTTSPAVIEASQKLHYCSIHEQETMDLYCKTCEELLCRHCTLEDGKHHSHDYHGLSEAFEKYKKEISSSSDQIEKQIKTIKGLLAQLNVSCKEITDQQVAINNDVQVTFSQLQELLNTRKTELIGQLDEITEHKLKSTATQRDQLELKLTRLESCQRFMEESLKSGDKDDVLMMKAKTAKQVKELTIPLKPMPIMKADTVFSASAVAAFQNYGQVHTNSPCTTDLALHTRVDDQHIQGSPFNVSVDELCNIPILSIGEIKRPRDVAINQKRELIVTQVDGFNIVVFSPGGKKIRTFGTPGAKHGQFSRLRGVAVDSEDNILVVDSGNHRIQKFTEEGEFLKAVGTEGSGELQFSLPTGIVVDPIGKKVYVGDWLNQRVQVLNYDLTFFSTLGVGQFNRPWGIAFDKTGNIYVADSFNHRIQVFTAEGELLRQFGTLGKELGELCEPVGVAIDSKDMVYVSEGFNNRISVFTTEGQFVGAFGTRGKGPREFQHPTGLAVDDSGVLYVCDSHNGRVQVLNSYLTFPSTFGSERQLELEQPPALQEQPADTEGQQDPEQPPAHQKQPGDSEGKQNPKHPLVPQEQTPDQDPEQPQDQSTDPKRQQDPTLLQSPLKQPATPCNLHLPDFPGIVFWGASIHQRITSWQGATIRQPDLGISLCIPEEILGSTQMDVDLLIHPCFSGPFELPAGYESASPAYLIRPNRKLCRPATLQIHHHATLRNKEDCEEMMFLSASLVPQYKQFKPVYAFTEIKHSYGVFQPGSQVGEINLQHFCVIKIGRKRRSNPGSSPSEKKNLGTYYSVRLYRAMSPLDTVSAVFCMCLYQPLYIKICDERIHEMFASCCTAPSTHLVDMITDPVTLSVRIPERSAWSVKLMRKPAEISKTELHLPEYFDVCTLSDYPPKFQISVERTEGGVTSDSATPELVVHGLDKEYSFEIIMGSNVSPQPSYCYLQRRPQQSQNYARVHDSHYGDLCEQLRSCAAYWDDIAKFLGFEAHEIAIIRADPTKQINAPGSFMDATIDRWSRWTPGDFRGSRDYATLEALRTAVDRAGFPKIAQTLALP